MKANRSIKLNAGVLTVAFALNTLIGFACSLGVDLGFNSDHHRKETASVVHIHKDGKKHIHQPKGENSKHNPEIGKKSAHDHVEKNKSESDPAAENCCKDKVVKFEQLDKSTPASITIVHPPFDIAFTPASNIATLSWYPDVFRDIRQFSRNYHPPISDIRIAIQSFQI